MTFVAKLLRHYRFCCFCVSDIPLPFIDLVCKAADNAKFSHHSNCLHSYLPAELIKQVSRVAQWATLRPVRRRFDSLCSYTAQLHPPVVSSDHFLPRTYLATDCWLVFRLIAFHRTFCGIWKRNIYRKCNDNGFSFRIYDIQALPPTCSDITMAITITVGRLLLGRISIACMRCGILRLVYP